MLQTIAIILLILWLLGFSFKVGGNLIHTLLLIALILFVLKVLF
ncbi:MAG: lmo0937 family membrane protein [Candidatus Colwellbacteria bacterium]|nr:lmo0937 family membrane protein [Candidatus Colwellbacteria bacterium]